MTADDLLAAIEAHLKTSDEGPVVFGKRAVGDPNFVYDLRAGREPRRATVKKVLAALPQPKRRAA